MYHEHEIFTNTHTNVSVQFDEEYLKGKLQRFKFTVTLFEPIYVYDK